MEGINRGVGIILRMDDGSFLNQQGIKRGFGLDISPMDPGVMEVVRGWFLERR